MHHILRLHVNRVTALQTEKNSRLFSTKLQATCRTNAHLLIQMLREHHVRKKWITVRIKCRHVILLSCHNQISPHHTNSLTLGLFPDLTWRRGSVVRTSVFDWRTFPDLRLIYGWHVAALWVRCSLWGQPTRTIQPSIPLGLVNE